MKAQIIKMASQESLVFEKGDSELYEYNGMLYVVGSKPYVRHVAALKAHATRLREYIKKAEFAQTRHEAAVKAWVTRRAENPKYMINMLVTDMPSRGK